MGCIPCQLTFAGMRKFIDSMDRVPLPQKQAAQLRKVDAFLTVLGEQMVGKELEVFSEKIR